MAGAMRASVNELINAGKKRETDAEIRKYFTEMQASEEMIVWTLATTGNERDQFLVTARAHEDANSKRLAREKEEREAEVNVDGDGEPRKGKVNDKDTALLRNAAKASRILNRKVLEKCAKGQNTDIPSYPRLVQLFAREAKQALALIQEGKAPSDDVQDELGIAFITYRKALQLQVFLARIFEEDKFEAHFSSGKKAKMEFWDFFPKGEPNDVAELIAGLEAFEAIVQLISYPKDSTMQIVRGICFELCPLGKGSACSVPFIKAKVQESYEVMMARYDTIGIKAIGEEGEEGGGGAAAPAAPAIENLKGKFSTEAKEVFDNLKFEYVASVVFDRQVQLESERKVREKSPPRPTDEDGQQRKKLNQGTAEKAAAAARAARLALPTPAPTRAPKSSQFCVRTIAFKYFKQGSVKTCVHGENNNCHFRHDVEVLKDLSQANQVELMAMIQRANWDWATAAVKKACADKFRADGSKFI